jgi:transposase
VVSQGDLNIVVWGTVVLHHFRADDRLGRYVAVVDLILLHALRPTDVAAALELPRGSVYRLLARFEKDGVDGLAGGKGCRKATKIRDVEARVLLMLKQQGSSHGEAARRLGVSRSGVVSALHRLGWKPTGVDEEQAAVAGVAAAGQSLPMPTQVAGEKVETTGVQEGLGVSESKSREADRSSPEPIATVAAGASAVTPPSSGEAVSRSSASLDVDPLDRQVDRMMAKLGFLDDAKPQFAPGERIPRVGAFLAIPLLVNSGVFSVAQKLYGSLGPAFYGLRTSVLLFILMALLRIKRAEGLKEVSPQDLGRVIGLDRAPEMKTLRRKLKELAQQGKGLEFMRELAQHRAKQSEDCLGFLYIDGHVRVYSGQRELPKTYVMQRRLALPATTDYWVNDMDGTPVFVVTAEANEGMTTMLPEVLKEVRSFIGERRATIVFDRGGWSPKLFALLIKSGWHIMTYRKGKSRRVPRKLFSKHTAKFDDREVSYELAETRVRLRGCKNLLRQIAIQGEDGYQTQIVTSNEDLQPAEVAYRMFNRWRQENFFKYMLDEYALDALVDYGTELADPTRTIRNPKRKKLDKQIKAARAALTALQSRYGAAAIKNSEAARPTMRGFKIANATKLGTPLRLASAKVKKLEALRKKLPTRVPVSDTIKGEQPVRLRTETKRLSDTFKTVAYQTETALLSMLRPHYRRSDDEGRTLIASALQSSGSLQLTQDELRVTLDPLSSPHRTRAIQAVCDQLNQLRCVFPGTNMILRLAVRREKRLTSSPPVCQEV